MINILIHADMKKVNLLVFLLVVLSLFSLLSCGSSDDNPIDIEKEIAKYAICIINNSKTVKGRMYNVEIKYYDKNKKYLISSNIGSVFEGQIKGDLTVPSEADSYRVFFEIKQGENYRYSDGIRWYLAEFYGTAIFTYQEGDTLISGGSFGL